MSFSENSGLDDGEAIAPRMTRLRGWKGASLKSCSWDQNAGAELRGSAIRVHCPSSP